MHSHISNPIASDKIVKSMASGKIVKCKHLSYEQTD